MTAAKFRMALLAALGVAANLASDGLDTADWFAIVTAAIGAVGVYAIPNQPKSR